MDKLQLVAQIQAYTGIGIGLMIGLGVLAAGIGALVVAAPSLRWFIKAFGIAYLPRSIRAVASWA